MKSCSLSQLLPSLIVLLTFLISSSLFAELTLASPFTDRAVLQRETTTPVWGNAQSGSTITVEIAGQRKTSIANPQNQWRVDLDPMPANAKPQPLRVTQTTQTSDIKNEITLSDILIGDVWICSGQSNMQMSFQGIPNIKALAKQSNHIRSFTVPHSVALNEQDHCEGKWSKTLPDSAVAFSFAYFLNQTTEVPVGIILSCWGSSSIEAWMPRDMIKTVPHFATIMKEFDANSETQERITSALTGSKPWNQKEDIFLRRQPNILYNAMIHPLIPYACQGIIWYQGERNTQSLFGMVKTPWFARNSGMLKYANTLQQWIQRYRTAWQQEDLPFLVVMLPGYPKILNSSPKKAKNSPDAHSWAWMRESQLAALALPHTSVSNSIDLGGSAIHPKDKLPIGKRLALLAARDVLGLPIKAQGPVMKNVERQGQKLIIHFKHSEGLTTSDGKAPTAFWISKNSKQWIQADAQLDGETVILSSKKLRTPKFVRYAFTGLPQVNLINGANLPAYPFRTDSFPPLEKN